jgi:hypothetical protein
MDLEATTGRAASAATIKQAREAGKGCDSSVGEHYFMCGMPAIDRCRLHADDTTGRTDLSAARLREPSADRTATKQTLPNGQC